MYIYIEREMHILYVCTYAEVTRTTEGPVLRPQDEGHRAPPPDRQGR